MNVNDVIEMQKRRAALRDIYKIKSGISKQFAGHKGLTVHKEREQQLRDEYPEHFKDTVQESSVFARPNCGITAADLDAVRDYAPVLEESSSDMAKALHMLSSQGYEAEPHKSADGMIKIKGNPPTIIHHRFAMKFLVDNGSKLNEDLLAEDGRVTFDANGNKIVTPVKKAAKAEAKRIADIKSAITKYSPPSKNVKEETEQLDEIKDEVVNYVASKRLSARRLGLPDAKVKHSRTLDLIRGREENKRKLAKNE